VASDSATTWVRVPEPLVFENDGTYFRLRIVVCRTPNGKRCFVVAKEAVSRLSKIGGAAFLGEIGGDMWIAETSGSLVQE
jgi:hypothetical protein